MLLSGQQLTVCIQNGKHCEAGHKGSRIPADPLLEKEILGQSENQKNRNQQMVCYEKEFYRQVG